MRNMMSLNHTDIDAAEIEYVNRYGAHRSRAQLLAEIKTLSDDTYITAKHAAAVLDTTPGQLANWRMQRRGPQFVKGKARFIRYRISDLKAFMADRLKSTSD
jgi:hypothetical protein